MEKPTFATIDLSQRGENLSRLACCTPCFSHRRYIAATVLQGKYMPAGTDNSWPARIFECGLRKIYQHPITTCQRQTHVGTTGNI